MIAIGTLLRAKRVDRLWVKHPYVYHVSLADERRLPEPKQCRPPRSGLDVDMRREALACARRLGRWLPRVSRIPGERKLSSAFGNIFRVDEAIGVGGGQCCLSSREIRPA